MTERLEVLLVEDSEDDASIIIRELKKGGYAVEHRRVFTRATMAAALDERSWDLVLADHNMPSFNSLDALALVRKRNLDVPFIIVSGAIGEETAVAAMKAGAHDFVMKGKLARLVPAIGRELREAENRRMHTRAEEHARNESLRAQHYLDIAGTMVLALDASGTVTLINRKGCEILGRPDHEILGKNWFDNFIPPRVREEIRSMFPKYLADGGPERWENVVLAKGGEERIISWHNTTLRDGSGKAVGTLSSGEDITERKNAEEALRKSEQLFRLLAENAKDMIYRVRLYPSPAVEYISASALALTGHPPEEFLSDGDLASRLLPPEALAAQEKNPKMKGNLGGPVTMPWRRKDGVTVWLELVSHPVLNAAGKLVAVEGVGRDITERKLVEDALRESEEKFRNLAEQSPNMIFINVKGRVVYANHRWVEIMGYTREEFCSPGFDFISIVIAPEHRDAMREKYRKHLSNQDLTPDKHVVIAKDGRRIAVILSTALIHYGGETAILGTLTDITELKRSEDALKKSEEKYRELVENINDVIFSTDQDGVVTYISPAVERVLGFCPGDITGKKLTDLIHAEDQERIRADFGTTLAGDLRPNEYRMKTKTGEFCWVRTSSRPLLADGAPSGISGTLVDITEQKRAEENIRASLKEKEVLLKEIHHRVKNNLQIISSLLSMQSRRVKDAHILDVLKESQNRVQTMALIHDRIYRSADLSRVDLRDYITRLVNELYTSYCVDPGRVQLQTDLEQVLMGIEKAIPCGFIINELVSNSLKHAFPGSKRGILRICMSSGSGGSIRLSVADDGAGLPKDLDFRNTESLGLQLVCGLVTQLRGTIEREGEKGTAFRIEFRLGED